MATKNLTLPSGNNLTTVLGGNLILLAIERTSRGGYGIGGSLTPSQRGRYRVANDSLTGYVAYVGHGAMPDFTADPDGFATARPVTATVTPPGAGELDLYTVLRKRNKYGLESLNTNPKIITIDTSGDEVLGPVSAPIIADVVAAEDEMFLAFASYPGLLTDANPADVWRLYVKAGSAPTPGVDTPASTGAIGATNATIIAGPYATGGTTYHFAVTVYRASDSEESTAATTTLTLDADPTTPVSVPGGFVAVD